MKVRHSIDTANDKLPIYCESWIDYWKKHNKNPLPEICPQCDEPSDDFVGAHVENRSGTQKYILPVCNSCNSKAIKSGSLVSHFRKNDLFEVKSHFLTDLD